MEEAWKRSYTTLSTGATTTPPPPAREQGVNAWSKRPWNDAFVKGNVCMASSPRDEFSSVLVDSVVAKVCVFLALVRKTSLHPTEILSVQKASS